MALWTDIIDPATLTGYARESLAAQEARKGSLAAFLPNRVVNDVVARFTKGSAGLVQEAEFRAYDAEPKVGKGEGGGRVTVELPAIGQNIPVGEYQQLITRNVSDEAMLKAILGSTERVTRAVSDRIERLRGTVLVTGKATIPGFGDANGDDFGRISTHTVTAGSLWNSPSVDRLSYLQTLYDLYVETNGVEPGSMLMSNRVFRALGAGSQFQTQLLNGGSRPSTEDDVRAVISGSGLPEIIKNDRRTSAGRVIPDDVVLFLPAPVEPNSFDGTELGATFWGQTLTASLPGYGIEDSEYPGIVAGVYRNEKPPAIAEVISDAIALPVLANANLSLAAKVL